MDILLHKDITADQPGLEQALQWKHGGVYMGYSGNKCWKIEN